MTGIPATLRNETKKPPHQEHPMSRRLPGSRTALAGICVTVLGLAACSGGGGIDGKYYNNRSGEFAMELKNGKVISMQGQEGREMTYQVRGDSLVISDAGHGMADQMTFGIERDGTLSLGILGSLTKTRK
jgi:hypothetical protein